MVKEKNKEKEDTYDAVCPKCKKTFVLELEKGDDIDIGIEVDCPECGKKVFIQSPMGSVGYFKGKMCPFTQVKIGGTTNVASSVLFGAPTTDEYTWTHNECMKDYCAIWDSNNKQCSIKTIAKKLK